MEFHYNAFISYRHAELDSRVAEDVQKQLEHYHIPKAVQKETGIKRINRIFRDKSELPLTSNLNDDILDALKDADYLLLICSPRTKESLWVRKEVETFLETHGHEKVLTVLAEGDPQEVIPDILLEKTVETKTPDGQTVSAVVPLEPLSCDYRIGFRRARQTEIPRLAAAVIGCRYDELIRRQRQYQIRIWSAAAAVLCAAVAWLIWSNIRIRDNLNASLISQSRYLAAESANALNHSDRLLAVQLALEALPDEERDRPVTPEATYALSNALSLYRDVEDSVTEVTAKFSMENKITDYVCDTTGRYLALLDENRHMQIVDTETSQIICEDTYEYLCIPEMLCMDHDKLLVKSEYKLHCYDFSTGETIWCQQSEDLTPLDDIEVIEKTGQPPVIVLQTDDALFLLDGTDAEVLEYYDLSSVRHNDQKIITYFNAGKEGRLSVSDSEDTVILPYAVSENDQKNLAGFLIRKKDSDTLIQTAYHGDPMNEPAAVFTTDEGNIIVCGFTDYEADWPFLRNIKVEMTTTGYSYSEYTPVRMQIFCLDQNGYPLWHHEMTAGGYGFYKNYFPHLKRITDENGTGRQILCAALTNAVEFIDVQSGEVINRYDCSSVPVQYAEGMGSETSEAYLLLNGELVWFNILENNCRAVSNFMDQVSRLKWAGTDQTENGKARFFVLHDGDVYMYQNGLSNSVWTAFNDPGTFAATPVFRKIYYSGDQMLFCGTYDLRCYDRRTTELLYTADFKDDTGNKLACTPAGFNEENKMLYLYTSSLQLISIDTVSGQYSIDQLPSETTYPSVSGILSFSKPVLDHGLLYYAVCFSDESSVMHHAVQFIYDPEEKTVRKQWLPYQNFRQLAGPFINSSGTEILYLTEAFENIKGCIYHVSDDSFSKIEEDSYSVSGNYDRTSLASVSWNNTGEGFAVLGYEGKEIRIYDRSGNITQRIPWNYISETDICFHDGLILALLHGEDNRVINIYEADSGNRKASVALDRTNSSADPEWLFTDGSLYLRTGSYMYMIDTATWAVSSYCPMNCYGYDEQYQRLIAGADSSGTQAVLGYYPIYSVEQMTAMGRTFTGNQTLSDQQRSEYGLN